MQVPLYGLGIILTGAAPGPPPVPRGRAGPAASSIVVLVSYLWYGAIVDGQVDPVAASATRPIRVLGWGTTLGVVVLSLPLLVPAMRTGVALAPGAAHAARRRPPDRRPRRGGRHRPARPAGRRRSSPCGCRNQSRRRRAPSPSTPYVQAVYLLPVRRARRTGGHERLPGARGAHRRRRGRHQATLARVAAGGARADRASRWGCSSRRPRPSARSSRCSTPGRGDGATSTAALAALPGDAHRVRARPGRLRAHRPADPRPLRARPADRCRARRGRSGWASRPCCRSSCSRGGQSPAATLRWLGIASTLGHDPRGRRAGAAGAPDLGRRGRPGAPVAPPAPSSSRWPWPSRSATWSPTAAPSTACPRRCSSGPAAGAVALVVGVVALSIGDREMMSQVLQRGRSRRRGGSQA